MKVDHTPTVDDIFGARQPDTSRLVDINALLAPLAACANKTATASQIEAGLMALRESLPLDLDDLTRATLKARIRERFRKWPASMISAALAPPSRRTTGASSTKSTTRTASADPWPAEDTRSARPEAALAVALTDTLAAVEQVIHRFVVLDAHQAVTVTLWTALTHSVSAFDCVPYLAVTSAAKRCGKTRLFELLEQLVASPWMTGRTSVAALVAKIDHVHPTLLFDEADTTFNGDPEFSDVLRGILNTGFRRSGRSTKMIGQGANLAYKDFSTFGPKAFAGIGDLPDTLADRAIPIRLERRTKAERVERFRERDSRIITTPLYARLKLWGPTAVTALRAARPHLPDALHDRAQDVWESLLAIADLAGGGWPDRARAAAVALMGDVVEDDVALDLIHDMHEVFGEGNTTFVPTTQMLERLAALEDRPWRTWSKGRPITGHGLARLLKRFRAPDGRPIRPRQNAERTQRGYHADDFSDAWLRYPPFKVSEVSKGPENGPEPAFLKCPDRDPSGHFENRENINKDGPLDTSDTLKGGCEAHTADLDIPPAPVADPWRDTPPPPGSAEAAAAVPGALAAKAEAKAAAAAERKKSR